MRYHRRKKMLAEINIVPYIDVMLVLLLVFMITTPLLYQGLEVDLPSANANELDLNNFKEPLIIEINSDGVISLIQKDIYYDQVEEKDLIDKIASMYNNKKIDKVYIKGDKNIEYEKVIKLISILNKSGIENISLITLPLNE